MFVTRTNKEVANFYLDDMKDKASFLKLLNDPSVNILDKKYYTETEAVTEDGVTTSNTRPCVRLEWEECSL
jgi:hypothetical protein